MVRQSFGVVCDRVFPDPLASELPKHATVKRAPVELGAEL